MASFAVRGCWGGALRCRRKPNVPELERRFVAWPLGCAREDRKLVADDGVDEHGIAVRRRGPFDAPRSLSTSVSRASGVPGENVGPSVAQRSK